MYKYFIYSSQQLAFLAEVEKKMGKTFRVGTVYTKGSKRSFTEMSLSPHSRYADAKIVAEGEEREMKFILPKGV